MANQGTGGGFYRGGMRYQPEMTTLEIIEHRARHNIHPLMYWDDTYKTWIPCQRDEADRIDREADRVLFSDGLVWNAHAQNFIFLSGPFTFSFDSPVPTGDE
jgi:hypothetical protein